MTQHCFKIILLLTTLTYYVEPFVVHRRTDVVTAETTTVSSRLFSAAESSSSSSSSSSLPDLKGKTLYQRVFYRLSPGSEVEVHNSIVMEERVRFQPDPERMDEGYLQPFGPRTLILRDGNVEEGEIGNEFFTLTVHEDPTKTSSHNGAGIDLNTESTIATALYIASNPSLVASGKVLEIACDRGLASLLGCIGAGFVSQRQNSNASGAAGSTVDNDRDGIIEDVLTVPHESTGGLLPPDLELLTLTEADEATLNLAFHNVKNSGLPSSKIKLEELDWTTNTAVRDVRRSSPMIEYRTIVASDVAFNFPMAKQLAKTVANRLEPSAPYLSSSADTTPLPRFVHVCPDERDDAHYLHRLLQKGYLMSVSDGYLKLEKLTFVFQTLPDLEPETALDDLDLELQEFKERAYQSLTAHHNPDYVGGGSGELFFPIETGALDASASKYMETDSGKSAFWYEERPWYNQPDGGGNLKPWYTESPDPGGE